MNGIFIVLSERTTRSTLILTEAAPLWSKVNAKTRKENRMEVIIFERKKTILKAK